MKNAKLIAITLLASLAIAGCGSENKEDSTESAKTASEAIAAAVEAAQEASEEIVMEEDLGSNEGVDLTPYEKLYTFTLDGKEYHLDCSAKELFDDGWRFSNDDVTMDGPDVVTLNEALAKGTLFDAVEAPYFYMYKTDNDETKKMLVGIYSDSNEKKTLNDFYFGYFYVQDDAGIPLELATGITFGSTAEEVKECYGEPVSESSGILSYMFTGDDVAVMPDRPEFLNFYVADGKVFKISLQFCPVMSK